MKRLKWILLVLIMVGCRLENDTSNLSFPKTSLGSCLSKNLKNFSSQEGGCKAADGYVWSFSPEAAKTYSEAQSFCQNYPHKKYKDFELPNSDMLINLYTQILREGDNDVFRFSTNGLFWADSDLEGYAQVIGLSDGQAQTLNADKSFQVLCARVGSSKDYGCSREDGDYMTGYGGCLSLATGYVLYSSPKAMGWNYAIGFCRNYREPKTGIDDWVLTTPQELKDISSHNAIFYVRGAHRYNWVNKPPSRSSAGRIFPFFQDLSIPEIKRHELTEGKLFHVMCRRETRITINFR